ncbi:MAG: 4-hydroxy-3-methylbut-2-enyl diphosphate reductase [Candidatus Cloacimonetes bacterium]|nr:4-hydroxy-3-methylbut-2-enyl diphosphate reductase [Candidatus Cloacimonadota bacterium]
MKRIIVAIDGPAASGKSTTAKLLAKRLGYIYLDTGAMYRACAYAAAHKGISIDNRAAIEALMEGINLTISYSETGNIIYLNGKDISSAIRTSEMSNAASAISAIPEVRHKMVDLQRKLGHDGGIVLDGRDIGTVVFPDAEAKFFIVADVRERAKRRFLELQEKGINTPLEQVLSELQARDLADSSRAMAPLKAAPDAFLVDTSLLSIDEQVDKLYEIVSVRLSLGNIVNPNLVVRLAKHSGFCFGVRRAIQLAMEANSSDKDVYSLGDLIHNPQIVSKLKDSGVKVALNVESIHNSAVIIRSHGITRQDYELLEANHNEIIDATCPYVKRTHELIGKMASEGYQILILGDKLHPEVIGMLSYGNERTSVIAPGDYSPILQGNRLCLITQTTQKIQNLKNLACELLPKLVELKIFNTICLATSERQTAAIELAKESDLMIVIGGYNSSNTRALASLCEDICLTYHIESDTELDSVDFSAYQRIGIAAGASTPEEMIINVFNFIKEKSGGSGTVRSIEEIPLFKEESC